VIGKKSKILKIEKGLFGKISICQENKNKNKNKKSPKLKKNMFCYQHH
jgi:hypothetical protein